MSKTNTKPAKTPAGSAKSGPNDPRLKALNLALDDINKSFGDGSIMRMTDDNRKRVSAISSGALSVDIALGIGGFPTGRIIEIYGPESSGKTTTALTHAGMVQKAGGIVAMVDAEHALDPSWAEKLGVDVDSLLVSQPDTGEQGLEITLKLILSGAVDLVIVDSVAALVPKAEIEGDMGQSHVGLQARLMSQALRKIAGAANQSGTTIIFINQLREKIGVMFGSPEVTTGGKALKFYASVRLDIRRIETLKQGTDSVGSRTRIKVVKNKMAPPFKQAEFDLMYGSGFSLEGEIIDIGQELGFIRRAGSWFAFGDLPGVDAGTQIGQGKENARQFFKDNAELRDLIYEAIREHYFGTAAEVLDGETSEE